MFLSWRLGFPCTHDDLKAQACKFMRAAGKEPHGDMEHWLTSFLHRHADVTKQLHAQFRAPARYQVTQDALNDFYELVAKLIQHYKLRPEDIYNLDETGTEKLGHRVKVIVPKEAKEAIVCGASLDEHMTWLGTIRADGMVLPPLFIFKGSWKTIPRACRLTGAPEGSRVTYTRKQ